MEMKYPIVANGITLDMVTAIALDLVKERAMNSYETTGELDANGHPVIRFVEPRKVIERAFELATIFVEEAEKREGIVERIG